jgi:hypothetical protein
MLQGIRRRLTFSNVVALLALFVALGSSSLAEPVQDGALQLIREQHIASNAVTSRHLRSNAVTSRHVDDGSLTGADVRNNVLRARDLRAGVAATDVLGTARFGRGARGTAVGRTPATASQASGICNTLGQLCSSAATMLRKGRYPHGASSCPSPRTLPCSRSTARGSAATARTTSRCPT